MTDEARVYPPDGLAAVKIPGQEAARVYPDGELPGHPSDLPPDFPPPVASFSYAPPAPKTTDLVTFDGSASTPGYPDAPVTAWDWAMDTLATRSGQVVTWRLPSTSPSSLAITLTVTASDGQTGQQTQVITI